MKSLELTQQQKDKLLEMCKVLFPEIYSEDTNIFDIRGGDNDTWYIMHYGGKEWDIIIHWFELMWIILNKICETREPLETHYLSTQFGMVCFNRSKASHPVDYLYEIFKDK